MSATVLIIDDNENDILITKRVISKMGWDVKLRAALSGEAGLDLLKSENPLPALILLDLKMPGMDGFEVLRKIRHDKRLKHIPVSVVTHSALESDLAASYAGGANCVLHKTLDVDQFGKEIAHLLERYICN